MGAINDNNRQGSQDPFSATSSVNQSRFQTKQALKQEVQTSYLARIDKCESKEETSGASYVSATPLAAQTDAEGNKLEMVSLPKLPHVRYQQGIAAFIVDPVPGDIMVMSVCKHDISKIKQGVTEPAPANSTRNFSMSDSVAVGAVHTKTPTNHITLRQDDTLFSRCPQGYEWQTDKTIKETALEDRIIELGRDKTEHIGQNQTLNVDKDQTCTIQGNRTVTVEKDSTHTINGQRTETIAKDSTHTINGNQSTTVAQSWTLTVNQDGTATITGNFTASIQGNATISVQGNLDASAQGSVSITSASSATIKATSVTIDAPTTTITGNLSLGGNLSAGSGGGGGQGTFNGSLVSKQTITGQQDVVAGSISLKSHIHGNGNEGNPTTGPM